MELIDGGLHAHGTRSPNPGTVAMGSLTGKVALPKTVWDLPQRSELFVGIASARDSAQLKCGIRKVAF